MDELIEFVEEYEEIQFLVSLDYNQDESELYSCNEWANLYDELGEFGNNPLILNTDPEHPIWNMFAGTTYSAYALIDHNMVLRYIFDMPNLYDFQYTYIPNLLDEMHGCIDSNACNYDMSAVIDDGSCLYNNECSQCDDASTQNDCMEISGCMWMGDHCMESNDGCMDYYNEFDCLNQEGCYWMGNHCMMGSTCTDPIAFNYNPIADALGDGDNSACLYSQFIVFGCTYESANNFNPDANVDDGTCEYSLGDLNEDGTLDILDVVSLVNIIMNFFTD
jgi:hypothetical protein